jgi:hypothetical protein
MSRILNNFLREHPAGHFERHIITTPSFFV